MKGTIELTGMEFHSFHGCLPEERRNGNRFLVDFSCEYDVSEAVETDALQDTLNYAEIYDLVAEQMALPSNLLEHVAGRILSRVEEVHPELEHMKIRVSKASPPVSGPVQWSSVTIEK